jgi:hypothetical protein
MEENQATLQYLHVVSLTIPYPPNYGGAIDIYYKIKALHECGVKVILHCFEYDQKPTDELEKICHQVFYYSRKKDIRTALSLTPFIVTSRKSPQLLKNLINLPYPILFEGLHCTGFLDHPALKNRMKMVRTHNIEHHYYWGLSKNEHNPFKRIYFILEAIKLKIHQKILVNAQLVLAISPEDTNYLTKRFRTVEYLPAFHPFLSVSSSTGTGKYLLIHGNLSVNENIASIRYLTKKVLSGISFPIIIAGKNPSGKLLKKKHKHLDIKLIPNPDAAEMNHLIKNAHLVLMHTFQPTGIKLKLLTTLFSGRHIICNSHMVENTGTGHLCHLANSPKEWVSQIERLIDKPFTLTEIAQRNNLLHKQFNNTTNALKIVNWLPPNFQER